MLDCLGESVIIEGGKIRCGQFPFVVMTSNGEREFPPPFLRRCVRLKIEPPEIDELTAIVHSHLERYPDALRSAEIADLVGAFLMKRTENAEVATDQLLNAVFLTVAMRDPVERTFSEKELKALRDDLLRPLTGTTA